MKRPQRAPKLGRMIRSLPPLCLAGLSAARARGQKGGWPKGVDQAKQKAALALKRDTSYSIREICQIVGISRYTCY
jgi:DNA invertase Pin-like site-specific DNA recombinase